MEIDDNSDEIITDFTNEKGLTKNIMLKFLKGEQINDIGKLNNNNRGSI